MTDGTLDDMTNEEIDLQLRLTCAYAAVREHFSHLTIAEIITPPRSFADAFVAQHMATAILCEELEVSRKRAARLLLRFKSSVFNSFAQTRARRASPVFDRVYIKCAERALQLYAAEAGRLAA